MTHTLAAVALAATAVLTAGPAAAEPFTLVIYETADDLAARTDPARAGAYWSGYGQFAQSLGPLLLGGGAVEPVATGRAVGRPLPGALTFSGSFVVDAADLDEAQRLAERLPAAKTGRVEVRRNVAMAPAR